MARMNSLEKLGAYLAAQQPPRSPARAPGEGATSDPTSTSDPAPGTLRRNLLMQIVSVPSLPPNSRLSDEMVVDLLGDPQTTRARFHALFCVPPGEFYCEEERTRWMTENPWCAGAVIPLVVTPTFTSDVFRNAWIDTHRHCPKPPPVLTNHMCTPGEPGCATPVTSTPAPSNSGVGMFVAGAAAVALLWWLNTPSEPRTNPHRDAPSAKDRIAGLYSRMLAADAEFSKALRKAYGSSADDMRYRIQKQRPGVRTAGKRYEDAMANYVKAKNEYRLSHGHEYR